MIKRAALGIDIGGTKVAAVLVDSTGQVLARERGPVAPESNEAALASIFAVSDRLLDAYGRDRAHVAGIGAGAPGGIDWRRGVLTGATNLAWQDLPLGQALSERYGVPALVDNDVNVAAWGERCFGGGSVPIQHLAFITVGTGIGAGLIENGRIVRGRRGAGEIGHIPLLENGPRCKCGLVGCLEAVASGPALGALGQQLAAGGGSPALLALAGGSAEAITAAHVFAAAQQGDTGAQGLLKRQGYYLALCVLISWRMLDPDVVVIGGGMVEAGPPLFEALWSALRRIRPDRSWGQQIGGTDVRHDPSEYAVPTRLGADAGAVGAAALVLQPEAGFVEEGIISLPSR